MVIRDSSSTEAVRAKARTQWAEAGTGEEKGKGEMEVSLDGDIEKNPPNHKIKKR